MVHIIDIEVSGWRLAGRITYGLFIMGLLLFLFYYLPTHLEEMAAPYVPAAYLPALRAISDSLNQSGLPYIGAIIAVLAFVEAIIKGTWVYGVILIVTGIFWLAFDIILYTSGVLFVNLIPQSLTQSYQLSGSAEALLKWILVIIIIIFVISSISTIVKGVSIVATSRRRRRKREESQLETDSKSRWSNQRVLASLWFSE